MLVRKYYVGNAHIEVLKIGEYWKCILVHVDSVPVKFKSKAYHKDIAPSPKKAYTLFMDFLENKKRVWPCS